MDSEQLRIEAEVLVVDLLVGDGARVRLAAEVLTAAFSAYPNTWNSLDAALEEVGESFGDGRLSLVALDAGGDVVGWVGGIRAYSGLTWELHPLAVRPDAQGAGVGRALVAALEARVRQLGGASMWLTTDDRTGGTSLFGRDLYPDPLGRLAGLRIVGRHPIAFYFKQGFSLSGVIPDAYGRGLHEFLLVKRLRTEAAQSTALA